MDSSSITSDTSNSYVTSDSSSSSETIVFSEPVVVDIQPVVDSLENGFIILVLILGFVCGLLLSKIMNWWKW